MRLSVPFPRFLLATVWLGLFLAGCMTQMDLITGPKPGTDDLAVTRFAKTRVHGSGQWATNPDGTRQVGVALAPLRPDPVPGRFRIQDVAQSAITAIRAEITAPDLASPVFAQGANAAGSIAVTNGAIGTLTFATVPPGKHRTLTVSGYDSGGTLVPGAVIRSLFDLAGSSGSFEVSPRTTPAANAFADLLATNPVAAASIASADLIAFIDSILGVSGSYPNYTYATHPSLVDTASLASALATNGGSTTGFTAASFAMPGAQVSFSFYLPYDGAPTTADQPTVWLDDPATEPYLLPHHPAGSGTLAAANTAQLAVTIHDDNLVDVTFKKVPPGTWKAGVSLSDDNTAEPNPKYFHTQATQGNYTAGHATIATVSAPEAQSSATVVPSFAVPPLDPKWVANQVRVRDDSQTHPASQHVAGGIASAVFAITESASSDKGIYVGPTIAGASPYALGTLNLPSEVPVKILGPAGVPAAARPILTGSQITLNTAGQSLEDVHLSGVAVAITGSGGSLQHVTVEGVRGTSGPVAGVIADSGFASLADVRVYNVRHMASTPGGADLLSGILFHNSAEGRISHCLVDDFGGSGGAKAVRFDAGGAERLMGIAVMTSGDVIIEHSQVIGLGRTGGGAATLANEAIGIAASGDGVSPSGAHLVTGCTVANLEAGEVIVGINLTHGTVAASEVRHLAAAAGTLPDITGLHLGDVGPTGPITASGNRIHDLNAPAAGSTLTAIQGRPAQGAQGQNGPILAITGNTIANCQGRSFNGILVTADDTGSGVAAVTGNVIETCSNVDAADSSFKGIATPPSAFPALLEVSGNRISDNDLYASGSGIAPDAGSGELIVTGNQVSGNTIVLGSSFSGIAASGGEVTLQGNGIYDNMLSFASGNGAQVAMLKAESSAVIVETNRVSGNTFMTGDSFNGASIRMVVVTSQGEWGLVAGNLISAPGIGAHADHYAMEANAIQDGGLQIRGNSIYQAERVTAMIRGSGAGYLDLTDNVLASANQAGSTSAVSVDSGLQSGGSNTVYPWAIGEIFDDGQQPDPQNPIAAPTDRQAGLFPFQDTETLVLITDEAPPAVTNELGSGPRGHLGYLPAPQ